MNVWYDIKSGFFHAGLGFVRLVRVIEWAGLSRKREQNYCIFYPTVSLKTLRATSFTGLDEISWKSCKLHSNLKLVLSPSSVLLQARRLQWRDMAEATFIFAFFLFHLHLLHLHDSLIKPLDSSSSGFWWEGVLDASQGWSHFREPHMTLDLSPWSSEGSSCFLI